jgi:hypothetical protein
MNLRKIGAIILFGIGAGAVLAANPGSAPEIDPASGMNALALVAGALLIIRGRKK